ncbi:MAG: hypothetical protein JNL57_08690 [Bacteroidetes bacterium]|nr:hypothetical protein [Bacteroidota bacterium]
MFRKKFLHLLLSTLMLCCGSLLYAQGKQPAIIGKPDTLFDPFEHLTFNRVVAYNFNYDSAQNKRLHSEEGFNDTLGGFSFYKTRNKSSLRILDSATIQQLIVTLQDTSTFGNTYGDCFFPRMGITFLQNQKEVFSVLICFECNFLESSIILPASRQRWYEFEAGDFSETGTKVRRYYKGFSATGKNKLLKLCNDLNMGFCAEPKKQ